MSSLDELKEWVVKQQSSLPEEGMDEHQLTIFATLQLVKNQIDCLIEKDKKNKLTGKSPGYYGC